MPRVLFCPFQCVYALEFPLVFFFFISCAKTILFNLVSPKLVDRALSSGFLFGIQFQEDEEGNLQVDFESVLVKVFRDSPLFGAGVDVLAVGGVLHQRHVVVGGQGEVGHAAHQASNILPVRVEGDLLHATFSETREEIVRKWLVLSTVARWVLGEGPTLTDIQGSVHVELSHLSWRPPCFRPVVVHCQLPRLTVPAEAGDRRHLSLTVLGSYCSQ